MMQSNNMEQVYIYVIHQYSINRNKEVRNSKAHCRIIGQESKYYMGSNRKRRFKFTEFEDFLKEEMINIILNRNFNNTIN